MNALFVKKSSIEKREIQNSILIKIKMGGGAQADVEYFWIMSNKTFAKAHW